MMKPVHLSLAAVAVLCRPGATQDERPLKVEPDQQNVVASLLEGSWESDAGLCQRLGVRHDPTLAVAVVSDPDVVDSVPAKYRARLAGKRIYMAGRMTLQRGDARREHPFLLVSRRGNSQILYFRPRGSDAMGDSELANVTVARAARRPKDVLLLGGDFNNQPFTPLRRVTVKVVQVKGSDMMIHMAQRWADQYRAVKRQRKVAVTGGGSGAGLSALVSGAVHVAMTTREMRQVERQRASGQGIELRKVHVASEALAVVVHEDNPVKSLTVDYLAAIYGDGGKITRWSQLGAKVPNVDEDAISLTGRPINSGTHAMFKKFVLGPSGKFRDTVTNTIGSRELVTMVAATPTAIGYVGAAYTKGFAVRVVPIAGKDKKAPAFLPPVMPGDPRYSLARKMYLYVRSDAPPEVLELVDWILGEQGQAAVQKVGYLPARQR